MVVCVILLGTLVCRVANARNQSGLVQTAHCDIVQVQMIQEHQQMRQIATVLLLPEDRELERQEMCVMLIVPTEVCATTPQGSVNALTGITDNPATYNPL